MTLKDDPAVSGKTVTVNVDGTLPGGRRITARYDDPEPGDFSGACREDYTEPLGGDCRGPAIQDWAGNDAVDLRNQAVVNNAPAPTITAIAIEGANHEASNVRPDEGPPPDGRVGNDDTFAIENEVKVKLTFSEEVVIGRHPTVDLEIGGANGKIAKAAFPGGGAARRGTEFDFIYEIEPGDRDDDGIAVVADSLDMPGGAWIDGTATTIGDLKSKAIREHDGVFEEGKNKVETRRPVFEKAVLDEDRQSITLFYDEELWTHAGAYNVYFTVKVDGRTLDHPTTDVLNVHGDNWSRLKLSETVPAGAAVTIAYDDRERADKTAVIEDWFGNDAEALAETVVETPVTVSFQKDTKEPGLETSDWSRVMEGHTGIVSVVLSRAPEQQVTVPLKWTGTGGAEPGDYEAPDSVTFAAGQTRELVSLHATADDDDEQPEDVQVTLGARPPDGYIAGTPSAFTFRIHDDDGSGVTIEPLSPYVTEGGPLQRYSLVLDTKPDPGETVILRAHWEGDDLTVLPTESHFTEHIWDRPQEIRVSAKDDNEVEGDETIRIGHRVLNYGLQEQTVQVAVHVADNDGLAISDASGTEGTDATIDFRVTLHPAASDQVTVEYATADRTATAGKDYTATSGTLTFAVGETRKTISVPITDDGVEDPGETFEVRLSNPSGSGIREAVGIGTIHNTDPASSSLSVADAEGAEGGDALAFVVTLAPAAESEVSVEYSTSDGSAIAGADYTATSGTLTFSVGETSKTVSVAIVDDDDEEETETVRLALSTPSGATLDDAQAVGTITDNDSGNSPATGKPTISGTPQVGQQLTASSGDIADADGLDEASFDYQWIRGGADIGGATGSSYTPVQADVGERLKVRASFTDDDGNAESRTSEATGPVSAQPNSAATGRPTISGTAQVGQELTASTGDIADADGLDDATFAYQWIRGSSDIDGATGSSYTLAEADEGERMKVRVSFTDDDGNDEAVTSEATEAVQPKPEPLTATFSGVPAEHGGAGTSFSFELAFSENVKLSYVTLRDEALEVSGGSATRARRRTQGSNQAWDITIEPSGTGNVGVRLPATASCNDAAAICTADGRALSNSVSASVTGPAGLAVADAEAEENEDDSIDFTVKLDRAAAGTVTVDYATSDGSATAGADYTAASGTLTFAAGDRSKTVEVELLDDSHDEGDETFTLTLSNPSGAVITDGTATGTIENHDPLPRALLARFGRAAATHVADHVEERLQARREPGFRGRFAGYDVRRGGTRQMALSFLNRLGGGYRMQQGAAHMTAPGGMPGHAPGIVNRAGLDTSSGTRRGLKGANSGNGSLLQMAAGNGDLLGGAAFTLDRETSNGGTLSFWSRTAQSSFQGREGVLALDGDVRTTIGGADYAKGPLIAGLSLARSTSLDGYRAESSGQVESAVTGLYPWIGYQVNERVSVWGVTGYGSGALLLTPAEGRTLRSGMSMAMAAGGARGELTARRAGRFALAFKTDALWVGTAIDGVDGSGGRLKATAADVTRVRTGLEGSLSYVVADALTLTPVIEIGLRHDGGDAETGAGLDVGSGIVIAAPSSGLAVDVRVRMLLMHQADGFREHGTAVSVSYDPRPATPLGLSARVAPSWGAQATGGVNALWGRETMATMGRGPTHAGAQLDGEVGYGIPVGSRFVGTPRIGLSSSEYGRAYRLGYGMTLIEHGPLGFEVGVDAQRRQHAGQATSDTGILGRATVDW